jgi:putative FmdB family regulatory protein
VPLWFRFLFFHITSLPLGKDYNSFCIPYEFSGRFPMPVYDYLCNDCHKEFEKVLTLNQHDHEEVRCPHCGSGNVEQEAKEFFAVTSKKS